jgi:chaperone modulatory protein CbpM
MSQRTPGSTISEAMLSQLIEHDHALNLAQLSGLSGLSETLLLELCDSEVIVGQYVAQNWYFDGLALSRARRIYRLQRDFELPPTAVALVMDLLDELQHLRQVSVTRSA